ncbi:MAG: acyl-CoA dehydrogenase family protein, partial [Acidimicrobiales bacterium]|nr:acyl-CoA dehydrogenase family protein [Acidimicrobiales bacterium]
MLHTVRRFTADRCAPAVARAAMEADPATRSPFWDDLANLGWLGLAVAEDDGGEGYGYGELSVVLEELGRVMAPGPMLPTVWAAAVVVASDAEAGDATAGIDAWGRVRDLASGELVGTVALTEPLVGHTSGALTVVGTVAPVLCGAVADMAVVPVMVDGLERWCLVETAAAEVHAVASLDPTRPLASLTFDAAPAIVLPALTRERVAGLGVALAAAECAGGAAWCVDTAATYATDRRQFGRPIGQFQAVKHKCADMLVHLEQVRGLAWDAAAALDEDPSGDEAGLVLAAAGAVAFDGYAEVAKDCIQVLGGIGFTWEHDAHLYLRRAMALRQLFGGASPWRQATARAALAGTRRHLRLELPAEAEAFRDEI